MPGLVVACVVAILLFGDGIASAQMSHHHALEAGMRGADAEMRLEGHPDLCS